MSKHKVVTGDYAAAEAMRQIGPDVVAAYPITPQTEIVMTFSQFVADGIVDATTALDILPVVVYVDRLGQQGIDIRPCIEFGEKA